MRTNVVLDDALMHEARRASGLKTRKETIDTIIGTFCIEKRIELLHNDRDFDVMVEHLGLEAA